ncbi:MAG: thioredoxin family protein [Desulfobacterales bacterium]|nr:thioredoxin family protein [Desulfobacterales bacterium]
MSQDDVTQIRVGDSHVGIVGLKAAIADVAKEYGERPDREVMGELLNRLGRRNYIPENAKKDYEKAFLREFKKFLGKEAMEDRPEGLEIKVLGPGCAQCNRLEQELMAVMSETGTIAAVEHVRDIKEIGKYGVMGTPALLINGEVKCVGRVPPRNKLKDWLKETQKQ